jgi:hypothetical protein
MSAHLHAVPDPEPEAAPAAGEWPVPVPAALPTAPDPEPEPDDEPDEEGTEETRDEEDAELPDDAADEEEGEPTRRRALTFPDLRPYADPRPLAELGPLAVQVGKTAGPPALRVLGRAGRGLLGVVVVQGRGLVVLVRITAVWLSGEGKGPSVGGRLLLAAGAVYGVGETWATQPGAPWLITGGLLVLVAMAASGRIKAPAKKGAKKPAAKAPAKQAPAAPEQTPAPAAEEGTPAAARAGVLARLAGRRKTAPAEPVEQPPVEAPEEADEQPPQEAPEGPVEDPLTALIREQIGAENGVHLEVLRPAMREVLPGLAEATDKQLREVLVSAGWDPSRKFRARGAAGRAGVHRDQLPPLRSPSTPTGPLSSPALRPSPALSPAKISRAESGGEWTEEEKQRGFRSVPDPKGGPAASKIQVYRG